MRALVAALALADTGATPTENTAMAPRNRRFLYNLSQRKDIPMGTRILKLIAGTTVASLMVTIPTVTHAEQWQRALVESGESAPLTWGQDEGMLSFIEAFWMAAWDQEFVRDHSGIVLEESGANPEYRAHVVNNETGNKIVAEGFYVEADRFLLESLTLSEDQLERAGLANFGKFAVAGTITGSSGLQSPFYGIEMELVFPPEDPGGDPRYLRTLTPAGLSDDVASAIATAEQYSENFLLPPLALRKGDRDCKAEHEEDTLNCHLTALACASFCAWLAAPPAIAACLACCAAEDAICLAFAWARYKKCLDAPTEGERNEQSKDALPTRFLMARASAWPLLPAL